MAHLCKRSNKDKKLDFYQTLSNTCVYLLEGHNLSESELNVSWSIFRTFVFAIGVNLGDRTWQKIFNTFNNNFNHSKDPPDEFMAWNFSDVLNETIHADWATIPKIPIEFPSIIEKRSPRKRSKKAEIFFRDYVNQGGGHTQKPSEEDMRSFAKGILRLIEEPKIKKS